MDLKEVARAEASVNRHPWELTRASVAVDLLKKYVPDPHRILDVGSGDAYIAGTVAKQFPSASVIAVDINYTEKDLSDIHNHPTNLILQKALLPDTHEAPFDAVLLMDVLEHIEQPEEVLHEIKPFVNEKTLLFITVPAFQRLYTAHDEQLGHYRRYNRQQINALLNQNGYQVIRSGYFFSSLLPIRWLQKQLRSAFHQTGLHNWKGNKPVTSFLHLLFTAEYKFSWYLSHLGIYLPGLTCYCICRPSPP